ncbi:hypothetical protein Bca52824_050994 [Brassica carinata]|uniref:phosphoglucomutase (alpha-D-glucose-1,6-bisphosphate-dependent) n=1 Tax=Brassica carinata TaxID=52824 RepID=A0A8X7R748_BRACI|nr:hypothetical protein Bca52824_050994 [Brassica carinata]
MEGKVFQKFNVEQCCYLQNKQFKTRYQRQPNPFMSALLPCPRGNLYSSMRANSLSKYYQTTTSISKQTSFYCNVSLSSATVPSLDKTDFLKLQNGSDIRGVAVPGVEGEPVSLPEPVTEAIAAAFGQWLLHKKNAGSRKLRVSVGHDSRISAPTLLEAVSRGLGLSGLDVVQFGLASTPAMFNSTLTEDESFLCPADGAIMITVYTSGLVNAVRKAAGDLVKPLEGFHIVVDAGNGAGGFFAAKVLEPLGAITSGSQFLEPDGMFPNHIPNPEDKTAMQAITKAVLDNKADLGIIFDTDVDRSAAVDSSGREFNRNRLIALLSAIVLEEHPGTTIVTDSVTSDGLTSFIEKKLGGKHHRFKRGYKNVIDEAIRLNSTGEESHLAIETSGHGALKENHWLDDGAYLMVKILNKLASARAAGEGSGSKVLTDLVEGLEEPKVALELRLKIDKNHSDLEGRDFREYGEMVLQQVSNSIETNPNLKRLQLTMKGSVFRALVDGFFSDFLSTTLFFLLTLRRRVRMML